ncbi:MAG: Tetratricopeptide repeat protein [Candidatus Argoarchaeum ethanivorans]|uniref:Tetratricopeptide repeat protein n=1 Tax=Candidatus Argoarchaeum ethanivorans TaxID=2608793 RepID=A0A811TEI5_9EURY|nr:MAG: Tetratricopeptide repeat protein [Candidatus Argoarchaeum ethanivorans]
MGTISKGVEVTLDKDELSLVDAVKEKVEQYKKTKNELLKEPGILITLGNEAYYIGQMDKALEYYKEALEIDEGLKDKRGKATDLNNIGLVYYDWGKPEKALEYYKESLAIFEELMDVRSAETVKENIRSITRQKHQ